METIPFAFPEEDPAEGDRQPGEQKMNDLLVT
jgi:hypothetical protein